MTISQNRIGHRPIAGSIITDGANVLPIRRPTTENKVLMNVARTPKRSAKCVVPSCLSSMQA